MTYCKWVTLHWATLTVSCSHTHTHTHTAWYAMVTQRSQIAVPGWADFEKRASRWSLFCLPHSLRLCSLHSGLQVLACLSFALRSNGVCGKCSTCTNNPPSSWSCEALLFKSNWLSWRPAWRKLYNNSLNISVMLFWQLITIFINSWKSVQSDTKYGPGYFVYIWM